VLPDYASQLDAVASALASTVNSAQMSGYDLSGTPGGPLFSGTTAASITVAVTDPTKLAASGTPGGNFDASIAQKIAGFGSLPGGANEAYSSLVGNIGTQVQGATQRAVIQQSVTTNVDKMVQSQSGVSFDEETTNLLTYQRSYQASSRVLTTVDEMLDTLINRTGKVGL
jgi:flagellar hook-associated protein 1 FlgK